MVEVIESKLPRDEDAMDGALYTGSSGAGYMYLHISTAPSFHAEKQALLERGEGWIERSLAFFTSKRYRADITDSCGFLLGSSGVWAVGAAIAHELDEHFGRVAESRKSENATTTLTVLEGDSFVEQFVDDGLEASPSSCCTGDSKKVDSRLARFAKGATKCLPIDFFRPGGDEMLVGRAGYLIGVKWLSVQLDREVIPRNIRYPLLDAVVKSGIRYSRKNNSSVPLMYSYYGTEYLGAAHGLAGILFALLIHDDWFRQSMHQNVIRRSVDVLVSMQTEEGNWRVYLDEEARSRSKAKEPTKIQWCHGAPGIVFCLAKAYLVWGDEKYLNSLRKAADLTWEKGLLWKGPGLCHGVAGNAEVFLLLYRLTKEEKYLYRAMKFQEFLFSSEIRRARTPDTPYSLYEGLAGTACFLVDLLHPEEARFPFMNVFS